MIKHWGDSFLVLKTREKERERERLSGIIKL